MAKREYHPKLAKTIERIAVEQCEVINPEHPEYVAEKIGELRDVLRGLTLWFMTEGYDRELPQFRRAQEVLTDIERKE